jgi:outer membrane protein OmpA-like peptidoglycan-associated protein
MQRLTAMTIGAALLGLAGLVYDSASAQAPKACSTRAVDIYFEKDSSAFNAFSQQLVERVAQEARSCGSRQVVIENASAPGRANAVSEKLRSLGVKVLFAPQRAAVSSGESIADRAVTLRVAGKQTAVG